MQEVMSKHSAMAKSKIKLDVGGQLFTASKETFLKFEGSFFFAMLSSGRWEPDEDGAYFIDRSPTYFPYVIDYLRTGSQDVLTGLSKVELDRVYTEFDHTKLLGVLQSGIRQSMLLNLLSRAQLPPQKKLAIFMPMQCRHRMWIASE